MRLSGRRMLLAAAVLAAVFLGAYQVWGRPDGATAESREALLAEALPTGHGWNLVSELELEGYLIGGAVDESGQSALAVFEPEGEDYRLQQVASYGAGVARDLVRINETWYNLVWFGGTATEYAEITYTVGGEPREPCRYETGKMPVLCSPAPADRYSISVVYYDRAGNQYT